MHTQSTTALTLYLQVVALSIIATLVSACLNSFHLNRPFRALASTSDSDCAPYKRQSIAIPSICTPVCDSFNNEVNLGCPATVCCTQSFQMTAYTCLLCIGTADNTSNYSQGQTDLDTLYTDCHQLGYLLPNLTLPGESPYSTVLTPAVEAPSATDTPVLSSIIALSSVTSTSPEEATGSSSSIATISTPGFVSAAMDVCSGVWALAAAVAAAVGLIVL